jgi:hypothetical protein
MAIELIRIGNIANDGTGDELRVAFRKINQNFEDVDIRLGDAVEGINTGIGSEIFRQRTGNDLEFRSLTAGPNISIIENAASIEISAPGALADLPVITDSGSYILTSGGNLKIYGGEGIDTSLNVTDNSIVITNNKPSSLIEDTSPALSATLDAQLNNIVNVNRIEANEFVGGSFTGTLFGAIAGVDIADINAFFNGFDFGPITATVSSFFEYIVLTTPVENGTIVLPAEFELEFGSLV